MKRITILLTAITVIALLLTGCTDVTDDAEKTTDAVTTGPIVEANPASDFEYIENEDGNIVFTLKNTGKGIPQKDLPFVFERFYKVDKARSDVKNSTGLGLYIVKTIVKAHGGKIVVSSKEDEYTTFKLELPIE